jgi:vacuolar-type H+-ATPase subunit B/Vma2
MGRNWYPQNWHDNGYDDKGKLTTISCMHDKNVYDIMHVKNDDGHNDANQVIKNNRSSIVFKIFKKQFLYSCKKKKFLLSDLKFF